MDSTPILTACEALLQSIKQTIVALNYPHTPITDYFRSKDIQLFKLELEQLSRTLEQLGSRHLAFPEDLTLQLGSILQDCDILRQQSLLLLDRESGTHAISSPNSSSSRSSSVSSVRGTTWQCHQRDEAFLLRHQLIQHRSIIEVALTIANLLSLKAIAQTASFSRCALQDMHEQLDVLQKALASMIGETFQVKDYHRRSSISSCHQQGDACLYLRRSLIGMRAALHSPRDVGVTAPGPELVIFVDRLLALAIKDD